MIYISGLRARRDGPHNDHGLGLPNHQEYQYRHHDVETAPHESRKLQGDPLQARAVKVLIVSIPEC